MLNLAQMGMMGFTQSTPVALSDLYDTSGEWIIIDFANTSTLLQESAASGTGTPVVNDGDAIGTAYSKGPLGLHIRHASNSNKSQLGSDGTRSSFAVFGVDDTPIASASTEIKDLMRFVHQSSPSYHGGVWIKRDTGSINIDIFSSRTVSPTTAAGTIIRGNSNGTLFVRGGNGTSQILNNTATTTTLNTSDGWTALFWDQVGTTFRLFKNAYSNFETITASGAGADVAASSGLSLGGTLTASAGGHSISYFQMGPGAWDASSVAAFLAHNPARNNNPWASLRCRFDYNTDCYSDTGMTTPTTNGGVIRRLKNQVTSPFGLWQMHGQAASDAASPILATNQINGKSAGRWAGDGVALLTYNGDLTPENGGNCFITLVAKNLTSATGSHIMTDQSGEYYAWPGPGWDAGFLDYHTVHNITASLQSLKTSGNNWNIAALGKMAGTSQLWNGNLVKDQLTGQTNGQRWISSGVSQQGTAWRPNMLFAYLQVVFGKFPDEYKTAELQRIQALYTGV